MMNVRIIAVLMLLSLCCGCSRDDDNLPKGLTSSVENFIGKWFPDEDITGRTVTEDFVAIILSDDIRLMFAPDGSWREITAEEHPLPGGLLPVSASEYISEQYPGSPIRLLERTASGYNVGLDAEVKVTFDTVGAYLKTLPWNVRDQEVEL